MKYNKVIKEYIVPCLIFFNTALIVLIQSPLTPFMEDYINFDSAIYLYSGWRLAEGDLMYLNFWDNKGPLIYFINMLGIIINYNHGLWLIEIFSIFISAVFMYKTFRIYSSKLISVLSVVYILFNIGGLLKGGNFTEEFALPFSYFSIYIFAKYIYRDLKYEWYMPMILGLSFAATIFLRPNIATIWPGFCIVYFFYNYKKNALINSLRFLLYFILGMIIVFIPVFTYLLNNNIFYEYINSSIIIPMGLEKPSLMHRLYAVLDLLSLLNFSGAILFVSLLWLIHIFIKRFENENIKILSISIIVTFAINLYANSLSGYSYLHYAITFVPILSLPSMFVIKWLFDWSLNKVSFHFMKIYITLVLIIFLTPSFFIQLQYIENNSEDTIVNFILDNTKDNDTIQVYSNHVEFYYKTRRKAASKFSYLITNGVLDDKFEKLMLGTNFVDIISKRPKVIVLSTEYEDYLNNLKFEIINKKSYDKFIEDNYNLSTYIDNHKIFVAK